MFDPILAAGPRGPLEWVALLAAASGVIAYLIYVSQKRKKIAQKRAVLGRKLGLRTRRSPGRVVMDGLYRGFGVDVDMFIQRSGRTEIEFTRITVAFPESLRLGLQITPRTLVNKLGSVLKSTVRLGDRAFDEAFILSARRARSVRNRFPASLLRGLKRFVDSHGHVGVDDDGLCFEHADWIEDNRKLERIIGQLVELAGELFPATLEEQTKRRKKPSAERRGAPSSGRKLARRRVTSGTRRGSSARGVPRRRIRSR